MSAKHTIAFLGANPAGPRLRLDEEIREIQNGLERSARRAAFQLEQRWAVRTQDLRRALLDTEPTIVHFSGHGAGQPGLVLEADDGKAQLVAGPALESLFQLCAGHVECVILNACYSKAQAEHIARHIPCVIGMNQAIRDKAAVAFSIGFYDALAAGRSYEDAFAFGRNAVEMDIGGGEHEKIELLANSERANKTPPAIAETAARRLNNASPQTRSRKPATVYVSYAWGDDASEEGKRREAAVDSLCRKLHAKHGIEVIRDKKRLQIGQRISAFMDALAEGDYIFLIFSERYLRTQNCMYEFFRIYRNCADNPDRFLQRVIPIVLPDAKISTSIDRLRHVRYWQGEKAELAKAIAEAGLDSVGQEIHKEYRFLQDLSLQIADMLSYVNDRFVPRDFAELERQDFRPLLPLLGVRE